MRAFWCRANRAKGTLHVMNWAQISLRTTLHCCLCALVVAANCSPNFLPFTFLLCPSMLTLCSHYYNCRKSELNAVAINLNAHRYVFYCCKPSFYTFCYFCRSDILCFCWCMKNLNINQVPTILVLSSIGRIPTGFIFIMFSEIFRF